jgi:hypothetical protein
MDSHHLLCCCNVASFLALLASHSFHAITQPYLHSSQPNNWYGPQSSMLLCLTATLMIVPAGALPG